jgi:hypothetical protein
MFGGYCADKISRSSGPRPLRVLVLEAGPFLVPTHVQNLPQAGLNVPDPIFPSADSGAARDLVWGLPWRSNVQFVGQAYAKVPNEPVFVTTNVSTLGAVGQRVTQECLIGRRGVALPAQSVAPSCHSRVAQKGYAL